MKGHEPLVFEGVAENPQQHQPHWHHHEQRNNQRAPEPEDDNMNGGAAAQMAPDDGAQNNFGQTISFELTTCFQQEFLPKSKL